MNIPLFAPPGFSLEQLGMAYRKAKVDLYYSMITPVAKIVEYEENLGTNLTNLKAHLDSGSSDWFASAAFLGEMTYVPKNISWEKDEKPETNGLRFSSPRAEWEHLCGLGNANTSSSPRAGFRLMALCSMDFHVLSALWMMEVGHLFDAELSESAYGNRLRRQQDKREINKLSLGSFVPYLGPFRRWRDDGIAAMDAALEAKKKVVALTADVACFYHELDPAFLEAEQFLSLFPVTLDDDQRHVHRLFVHALRAWGARTPSKNGLPVGLPASALVANLALYEFDKFVESQISPLHYGRYVDDIILVMENGAKFKGMNEVWDWLIARSDGVLTRDRDTEVSDVTFYREYLGNSRVRFANEKNKVFLLEGASGRTLVESLRREIHVRASEWRALPNLPLDASNVATDLVRATQSDGEIADNLRKADSITMRRAGFAIKLRDFEAYERDLHPDEWAKHRHAFLEAFVEHVMVLPNYFDLATYVPRVVRLATSCADFRHLGRLAKAIDEVVRDVEANCQIEVKSDSRSGVRVSSSDVLSLWARQLRKEFEEAVISAFPVRLQLDQSKSWSAFLGELDSEIFDADALGLPEIRAAHERYFARDLAHSPFRFLFLENELASRRGEPQESGVALDLVTESYVVPAVALGQLVLANWLALPGVPAGLLFATRPFSLSELMLVCADPFEINEQSELNAAILAVRGFAVGAKMPCYDADGILTVFNGQESERPASKSIALASWKTDYRSWVASVVGERDPDKDRYFRLNRLVNDLLSQPPGIDYLVFPELSLPPSWFMRIAQKLQAKGISLIAGVEYRRCPGGGVLNEVWAALTHEGLGFKSMMVYRQQKQFPALHEEQELFRLAGTSLKSTRARKPLPVIRHGAFRFALLVCSELTNIDYRGVLRGEIDALFVPEWNQDTNTFDALVESAALDLHAYIVQCNDRQYGDGRIRAPYKQSWRRDPVRIKGGTRDYFVVGDIDVAELRRFQSSHRSAAGPFKPVPDGFVVAEDRKMLPS